LVEEKGIAGESPALSPLFDTLLIYRVNETKKEGISCDSRKGQLQLWDY
jgi:hypothetical protein